jgi:hypothetical protein
VPDDRLVPMGVPGNPLWRVPMDAMLPYQHGYRPPQFMPEIRQPGRMENPGITNTGGIASATQPEVMAVPSPVSALDPAYSMHPLVRALSSQGGVSVPQYYSSSWAQLPLSRRHLSRSDLITALGLPGLGGQTQTQGVDQ